MTFPGGVIVRHTESIQVRNRNILDAMVVPKACTDRHAEFIEVRNKNIPRFYKNFIILRLCFDELKCSITTKASLFYNFCRNATVIHLSGRRLDS